MDGPVYPAKNSKIFDYIWQSFASKVGTLFVNLFQCTDETINGTVTSVFIWQILWKKISDANKIRFTSKCSSNNENDVQHVTIHRIRVRCGPVDKRGWVYDSNQRTNNQPSPHAVFQTWPIPHRALIFALKIAFKRSHAGFSRYLLLTKLAGYANLSVYRDLYWYNIFWQSTMNSRLSICKTSWIKKSIIMDFVRDIFDI